MASPNFDLIVETVDGGFTAEVQAAWGVGELPAQHFALPLDLAAHVARPHDVADWVAQARIRVRAVGSAELQRAREVGTALFEQLFSGELLACFRESRKSLPPEESLRLRLRLPSALASLPWELLYDPREDQFLALAPDLILVRYPEMSVPAEPLAISGPLHVVVVAASPNDEPPLDTERELARIRTALKGPIDRGRLQLDIIRGPDTLVQLQARLRRPAHVVHIISHGGLDEQSGEGILLFEDLDGKSEPINAMLLRMQIQKQRGQTRLVVLNACLGALPASADQFSSVGAALMRGGVPAVVAMQFAIPDDVAIDLARVFYTELAAGAPVDLAVNETRMQLYGRNPYRLDWVIPVLFLRAADGALFDIAVEPAHAAAPAVPANTAVSPVFALPAADPRVSASAGTPAAPETAPRRGRSRNLWMLSTLALLALVLVLVGQGLWSRLGAGSSGAETAAATPGAPTPESATATETSPATASSTAAGLSAPVFTTLEPTPRPPRAENVSQTDGRSEYGRVVVDQENGIHIFWKDITPRQGQSETIMHRRRAPDGAWSEATDFTPGIEYIVSFSPVTRPVRQPCLLVQTVSGLVLSCYVDGEWSPREEEVASSGTPGAALDREGRVGWLSGVNEVRYGDKLLSDGLVAASYPQLAVDAAGRYHAVWHRAGNPYSIEYRFSVDEGQTWSQVEQLSAPDAEFVATPTLFADHDGDLHLVWQETDKLVYRRWTPGSRWLDPVEFGTGAGVNSLVIGLAVDGDGHPHVAWSSDCRQYLAWQRADDTWTDPWLIAQVDSCGDGPSLAIDDAGSRHITWVGTGVDGARDVFYTSVPPHAP